MANNFVSYDNLDAILKDFNSKGVKVKVITGEEKMPDVEKYGACFNSSTNKIYCRVGTQWKEMLVGGLGDVKTGLVVEEYIPGSSEPVNMLHLGYYAENPETGELEWHDSANFTPFEIPAGGGGGGKSIVTIDNISGWWLKQSIPGQDVNFKFSFTSVDRAGAPTGPARIATISVDDVVVKTYQQLPQETETTYNLKEHLNNVGSHTVKVTITDAKGTIESITVTCVTLYMSFSWNAASLKYYENTATLDFVCDGDNEKTIRVFIDGIQVAEKVDASRQETIVVQKQGHGRHVITSQMEMKTNIEGELVYSDVLSAIGVWTDPQVTTPIITFEGDVGTTKQFKTTPIKWLSIAPTETSLVYKFIDGIEQSSETVTQEIQTWYYKPPQQGVVTLQLGVGTITGSDGVNGLTGQCTVGHTVLINPIIGAHLLRGNNFKFYDTQDAEIPLVLDTDYSFTDGTKTTVKFLTEQLTVENISYDYKYELKDNIATYLLTVTDAGIKRREITTNLLMDVNPEGHTNKEEGIQTSFGYLDRTNELNPVMHAFTYPSGFDWDNGGFQQDSDGNTAFVIKKGYRVQFDRSLFLAKDNTNGESSPQAHEGKNIEIIFKTANMETWDAEIASCYSNNIGLKMYGHKAIFTASGSIEANYSEDKLTELGLNIRYNDAVPGSSSMKFWNAGTPSGANIYEGRTPQGGGTSFAQPGDGEKFIIGSDTCDIWIYRFKMYIHSLEDYQVINNFVADCVDSDEREARDTRNDIFTSGFSGTVNKEKLMAVSPNLHIISIESKFFPLSKGGDGKVDCVITHQIGSGTSRDQWTTAGSSKSAQYTLQGTSSLNYLVSCGNLDLDMKKATMKTIDTGEILQNGYSLSSTAIPVKYFNLKANVASSENANNICLADLYNAFDPYTTRQKAETASSSTNKVRDTMEGYPCVVFIKNTGDSPLRLGPQGARTLAVGEEIVYFAGDMLNSKKNTDVIGQTDYENGQICMEFAENNYKKCIFAETGDFLDENYEFDYSSKDFNEIKQMYGASLSNPTEVNIKDELLYTVTGEEPPTAMITKKVKYYIKSTLGDPTPIVDEEVYTVTGFEPDPTKVSAELHNKNVLAETVTTNPSGTLVSATTSGALVLNVSELSTGTKITASYQYKPTIYHIALFKNGDRTQTIAPVAISENGKVTFDVSGFDPGTTIEADYEFTRKDQMAIRYPETEFYSGYLLYEGGLQRSQLLTAEHRLYYDYYRLFKKRFVEMHNFIASTCPFPRSDDYPAGYTGDPLPEPVEYGGVRYTHDTKAYRQAKFRYASKNVEWYFDKSQIIFHYLFTEFFTMVDNRGKNLFCSYEEDDSGSSTTVTKQLLYKVTGEETTEGGEKVAEATIQGSGKSIRPSSIHLLKADDTDITSTSYVLYGTKLNASEDGYVSYVALNVTDLPVETEIYITYTHSNGKWKYNFAKDYDNDKMYVVVKPYLIYGETQEIDNAEEDC